MSASDFYLMKIRCEALGQPCLDLINIPVEEIRVPSARLGKAKSPSVLILVSRDESRLNAAGRRLGVSLGVREEVT